MEKEKLVWCLKIKTGIKLTLPSEEEYVSYIETAKEDLNSISEGKLTKRWIPVVGYYCAYYSIYALLRLIGIKSENHTCSIEIFKFILKEINEDVEKSNIIEELRKKREEAQYYLKEIEIDLEKLKKFIEFIESIKNKTLLKKEALRRKVREIIEIANVEDV